MASRSRKHRPKLSAAVAATHAKASGTKSFASGSKATYLPKAFRTTYKTRGSSIGIKVTATSKVIDQLNQGFPFKFFHNFQKSTDLPLETIADAVRIPPRTLSRRKAEGRLQPDESERLLRLSTVFEKALDLFDGDRELALRWLRTPQPALGGEAPLDFAQTEIGASEVQDLIGRLGHGVFT